MNFIKNLRTIFFMAVFISAPSHANEVSALAGVNYSGAQTNGITWDRQAGFEIGGLYYYDSFSPELSLRTGAKLVLRSFSTTATLGITTDELKFTFLHLEVPITAHRKVNDNLSVFGGIDLGVKLRDSCEFAVACSINKPATVTYALSLGGHTQVSPEIDFEVGYQLGLNDIFEVTRSDKMSVGILYRLD